MRCVLPSLSMAQSPLLSVIKRGEVVVKSVKIIFFIETVKIDAAHRAFSFYANGVYYNPECGNNFFKSCNHTPFISFSEKFFLSLKSVAPSHSSLILELLF